MKWMILLVASLLVQPVWADNLETGLAAIQQRWAEIQYQVAEDDKEKAFEALAGEAETLTARYPDRAEALIWSAIVLSSWAGEKGGRGALGLVTDGSRHREQAIAIDDGAVDG